ncbi:MAG: rhodanese-like domain-containing protein [Cyanobacteria bacterium J06648_11]
MNDLPQISVKDLHERLSSNPNVQLIDVREPEELAIAHLNPWGFQNYPLSAYETWSVSILRDLDPHQPTYVLCHHGLRSAQMTQWLQQKGFTQVSNIEGGIAAWSQVVDATVPQY